MRCVLHIGTEKTGTTSIQETLERNARYLESVGVLYPEPLFGLNHPKLSCYAMDHDRIDSRKKRFDLHTAEKVEAFRALFAREIDAARARSRADTIILVNEHLSRLIRPGEAARIMAFLRERFETIDVVLYLRRQDLLMRSMYSTVVKVGGVREAPFPVHDEKTRLGDYRVFDYRRMAELWLQACGRSALTIRLFQKGALKDGDAVSDFLDAAGIGDRIDLSKIAKVRRNEGLDPVALEVLRRLNLRFARNGGRRAAIARAFETCFPGPGPTVDRQSSKAFLAHFEAGNAWVARTLFGRDALFETSDLDALPDHVDPPEVTVETALDVMAQAWSAHADIRLRATQN